MRWRPELRFYEQRVTILRELEDRGRLRAFQIHEDQVDAQLLDVDHQLSVRQDGFTLKLFRPDADTNLAWDAVALAVGLVRPAHPRVITASYQHIVELTTTFEEAVARGYDRMFDVRKIGTVELVDWAFLADFRSWGEPPASGQIEFGVVHAEEVPERLARLAGRIRGSGDPANVWEVDKFPMVALFSDATFHTPADQQVDPVAQARSFWGSTTEEVGNLILGLHNRLNNGKVDEEVTAR
jgi:hypothetical protein